MPICFIILFSILLPTFDDVEIIYVGRFMNLFIDMIIYFATQDICKENVTNAWKIRLFSGEAFPTTNEHICYIHTLL